MYNTLELGLNSLELLPQLKNFKHYFSNDYNKQPYFFGDGEGRFYLASIENRTLTPDNTLSCVYWAIENENCSLIAGGVNPFAIHADLCHSYSLDHLRSIFYASVDKYGDKSSKLGWEPPLTINAYYVHFVKIVREIYGKQLL